MKEPKRRVEDVHENGTGDLAILPIVAEPTLDRLEVPIRELVPHEAARALGEIAKSHAGAQLVLPPHATVARWARRRRPEGAECRIRFGDCRVQTPEHPVI